MRLISDQEVVFTRTGAPLQGVDAVAAYVRQEGSIPRRVSVSRPLASPDHHDTLYLLIPADAATEELLLAELQSPDLSTRALAAALLRPYESPANIGVLLPLLADQGRFTDGNGAPYGDRVACVHALTTLQAWEVPVAPDACATPN